MIAALATLAVSNLALIGALVYVLRSHAKADELKDARTATERTGLLNRIQAPEAATFMEMPDTGPQYMPFDDDRATLEMQEAA